MQNYPEFDEQNIEIGGCYAISLNEKRAFVKVLRKIIPNSQGVVGPARWIGERVGSVEEPNQEGHEIEVTHFDLIGRASRREMLVQAIRQGFETDKDIHDYLSSCGIKMSLGTVAGYRSQFRNGTLFKAKSKRRRVQAAISQSSDNFTPATLTMEICRLAKMVGGLKVLGQTVESLRQALETIS